MLPIEHTIQSIKQNTSECMQTAATQLLLFFDPTVRLNDVVRDVPVYVENGDKIGTAPGHIAAYFAQQGYESVVHVFDTELFDRSWKEDSPQEILVKLRQRQEHIPTHSWLAAYHHILVAGWELFIESGGTFSLPLLDSSLLHGLLKDAPYFMMLSSTYLNQESKQRYSQEIDKFEDDAFSGRSLTHAVICAGYREGRFLIVDPDPPQGVDHHRWIPQEHLIASIMAAQTESDNLLITIKPRE